MNKQQLASKIWESANKMRSKIEANEYKDYILGFIFYKFLSNREVKYLKSNDWTDADLVELTEEDEETVADVRNSLGYFIEYKNLFSTWIRQGDEFNAASVSDALQAFSRLIDPAHKRVFDGVFATLETGLSKLGETSGARTKAIRNLIYLIDQIPMEGRQDYDVLGFVYEYLIGNFAANAGKKAGEFYTPHEVSLLMSEIVAQHLKDRPAIKIYDPTSGSGSLLINIGRSFARYSGDSNAVKYYAQELKENTFNLTRMNLVMRDVLPDNVYARNADTLEEDWPLDDAADPLYVDAVVSNPPYSQAWNPVGKENDPRYAGFGLAPRGKADYAFLLHDLYHLRSDGIMTIVLPHGVLFRGGEEGAIRRNLVERNHIDAIIGLPPNIFFGTGIPTIVVVLKKSRQNSDVLIIDASKGFEKVGKNNRLRACDVKKIADVAAARVSIPKFSRVVPRDEIRANDYNLNIPRYVDSSEKPESWDVYASMFGGVPESELEELNEYWNAFPDLKDALFERQNEANRRPRVDDLKAALLNHTSTRRFLSDFDAAFESFESFLVGRLIERMETLNPALEENALSADVFKRLDSIPLVDRYDAYQILDDEWRRIEGDLEIIQSEGFDAVKKVDPRMVPKKKDGKDQEIQDGWLGRVIPFELAQWALLPEKLEAIRAEQERLAEIASELEGALEELPEEEKNAWYVNDAQDAFLGAEVKKALKAKDAEPEILLILQRVERLQTEEKALKKSAKENEERLVLETKKRIEALTDDEARALLAKKWIKPLVENIAKLPRDLLDAFVVKVEKLARKYENTFEEVERQIEETENSLSAMLGRLEANEFDARGLDELRKLLGGEL